MDAELLAIGPYSPAVCSALEYPGQFYADTPTGATVIVTVASCESTQSSRVLAQALGIDPWAFEQHCDLSGEGADVGCLADEIGEDVAADFLLLRAHGFKFYYRPNG